jgi:hypothetical protein
MKIRTLALTAAVLATATGYAFAQSNSNAMNPSEAHSGAKAQDTTTPANAKMHKQSGTTGSGVTGSDMTGNSNTPKSNANISPASPNAGEKQQK